jgi:hypothetical protein
MIDYDLILASQGQHKVKKNHAYRDILPEFH